MRISSSGSGVQGRPGYVIDGDHKRPALTEKAHQLVQQQLARNSLNVDAKGVLRLEVTLSVRPSHLALASDGKTLSAALTKRPDSKCSWNEYRLGVSLFRIADGAEVYRASAAEHHCKQPVEKIMPILAEAALADLTAPRGDYVVLRPKRPGPAPREGLE